MVTIVIILSILLICSILVSIFISRKYLKVHDILSDFILLYDFIFGRINYSHRKLKEIDASGHFESDDEVGFFFKEIQNIQTLLEEAKTLYDTVTTETTE
jgi:hypothetical protein